MQINFTIKFNSLQKQRRQKENVCQKRLCCFNEITPELDKPCQTIFFFWSKRAR